VDKWWTIWRSGHEEGVFYTAFFDLVRKGGFEPPRYCYRQPLKLVRLPVPPLPRMRAKEIQNFKLLTSDFYLFPVGPDGAGVAGGVAGVVDPLGAVVPDAAGAPVAGADCAGAGAGAGPRVPLMIEPDVPR
jgi:hypothetical protein